ncbi:MAG: hypothetical protein IJZ55_08930 [Lachnospiraceae bacterium]|nr:hypothetical protein [Lachnospiraceae bacterium]
MDDKYLVCCYMIDNLYKKGLIEDFEVTMAKVKVLEEIQRCNESYTAEAA